ncbi:hypothetical protein SAMN04487969_101645 [Paenibacillus algorifonticola]|uniref:Uncharacterized protein n=1 Tax=Paenibacillus algorifonticola TaxID=684063 RepID=A0A1I1YN42_9BACL|nr:hypothetical protein SAMN04487969_101645 [Paenibacillus algorifonticola]
MELVPLSPFFMIMEGAVDSRMKWKVVAYGNSYSCAKAFKACGTAVG